VYYGGGVSSAKLAMQVHLAKGCVMTSEEELKAIVDWVYSYLCNEHSGGCKFTEMIVDFVETRHSRHEWTEDIYKAIHAAKLLELAIRKHGHCHDIAILEYTWVQCERSKMFVYTI
jgi:hypothetical protein